MMISCRHCLCLLAVLPALCVASSTRTPHSLVVHGTHLAKATYLRISKREEYDGYPPPPTGIPYRPGYGSHIWHHTPPSFHASKFTGARVRDSGMISAGKKEDEQRDSEPVHAGVMPPLSQQPDGLGSSSAATAVDPLGTALASTSTPASSVLGTTLTSSFMSGSSSLHTQSSTEGQPTPSPSSASSLGTTSSASSSSALQPALLAFILIPVCIFLLGMMFALYRIYGKPGSRLPPVSPMFLGDSTGLGSGYHRDEAIAVNSPTVQPRGSVLSYDINKKGTIKWEPQVERNPGQGVAKPNVLKGAFAACHFPEHPFPTHTVGMRHHSPGSRVLRPYVPRPYHRPHPGYTVDPESAIPLIPNKASIKSQGGYITPKSKGKGKENVPEVKSHDARKHRDVMSTTPLNTSPRSLPFRDPVISAVFSDMEIRFQARTHPSSSSMVSAKENRNQLDVPSLSSTGTSFDIGLAMLSDFSSPNVGLGLDLSSRQPPEPIPTRASQTRESLISGSITEMSREAVLPYLEQSVTAGSKGLADQSSSSRGTKLPDRQGELIDDELDIVSALAMYRTHHANNYNKTQVDPLESQYTVTKSQDTLAPSSSESSEVPYTSSSVKAPTLPTLSEMALSRADPLYESVTNELFSSYGMRMSTASGLGRPSRVSARISRMLSWFADSGNPGNRSSVMDNRMSCENPEVSGDERGEGLLDLKSPGVQPLRIGKARKNAASRVHQS